MIKNKEEEGGEIEFWLDDVAFEVFFGCREEALRRIRLRVWSCGRFRLRGGGGILGV